MSRQFRIEMAPRRGRPDCIFCGGTGVLRLPTTEVYDVQLDCDCVDPEPIEQLSDRGVDCAET